MWLSEDAPASFLLEIVLRGVLVFVLTIGALRISGKRGVRPLSIFEFGLLLVLGSAASDALAPCPRCGQAQGWLPTCAPPRIG